MTGKERLMSAHDIELFSLHYRSRAKNLVERRRATAFDSCTVQYSYVRTEEREEKLKKRFLSNQKTRTSSATSTTDEDEDEDETSIARASSKPL